MWAQRTAPRGGSWDATCCIPRPSPVREPGRQAAHPCFSIAQRSKQEMEHSSASLSFVRATIRPLEFELGFSPPERT